MAYTVQQYINLNSIEDIQQRHRNLEFLLISWEAHYLTIKRIAEDPEFAKMEVDKWKNSVDDVKIGLVNCLIAIELLKNDTGEEDDEFEEDE